MNEFSKYKLFRKYITSNGVDYTPIDDYQAFDLKKENQCDCGYRIYQNKFDGEYICGMEIQDMYIDNSFYFDINYLEKPKSPWIDTGILAKPSLKYKIKYTRTFDAEKEESKKTMISAKNITNENENYNITHFWNGSDWEVSFTMPSGAKISKPIGDRSGTKINEFEFGNFYIEDVKGEKQDFEPKYGNVTLFYDGNPINNRADTCKIYYWKIYDNDILVRDFIPKVINGICGLWDNVEGKFYTSQTEDNFQWEKGYRPYAKYEIWNQHALCPDDPSIDEITKRNVEYNNQVNSDECGYYTDLVYEGNSNRWNQIIINGKYFYVGEPPISLNFRQDIARRYESYVKSASNCFDRIYLTKLIKFPDTSYCISTHNMFGGNINLTEVNLIGHKFNYVIDASSMFSGCKKLTNIIGIEDATFKRCIDFSNTFNNCYLLMSLNLSNFNTSNVTDMSSMFYNCSSLIELNLSNWLIKKNCNTSLMFRGCRKLSRIIMDNCNCDTINKVIDALNEAEIHNNITIYSNTGCQGTVPTPTNLI